MSRKSRDDKVHATSSASCATADTPSVGYTLIIMPVEEAGKFFKGEFNMQNICHGFQDRMARDGKRSPKDSRTETGRKKTASSRNKKSEPKEANGRNEKPKEKAKGSEETLRSKELIKNDAEPKKAGMKRKKIDAVMPKNKTNVARAKENPGERKANSKTKKTLNSEDAQSSKNMSSESKENNRTSGSERKKITKKSNGSGEMIDPKKMETEIPPIETSTDNCTDSSMGRGRKETSSSKNKKSEPKEPKRRNERPKEKTKKSRETRRSKELGKNDADPKKAGMKTEKIDAAMLKNEIAACIKEDPDKAKANPKEKKTLNSEDAQQGPKCAGEMIDLKKVKKEILGDETEKFTKDQGVDPPMRNTVKSIKKKHSISAKETNTKKQNPQKFSSAKRRLNNNDTVGCETDTKNCASASSKGNISPKRNSGKNPETETIETSTQREMGNHEELLHENIETRIPKKGEQHEEKVKRGMEKLIACFLSDTFSDSSSDSWSDCSCSNCASPDSSCSDCSISDILCSCRDSTHSSYTDSYEYSDYTLSDTGSDSDTSSSTHTDSEFGSHESE